MADLNQLENATIFTRPNWGAIWAGVFTFIAIWAVFGTLGLGIFGSMTAGSAAAVGGSVGMAIWAVVLTVIAMFFAGRITGFLAGSANSRDGAMHGVVMFGLAVVSALIMLFMGGAAYASAAVAASVHRVYLLDIFSYPGWPLFIALFLGWLAAMGGASAAHKDFSIAAVQHQIGHA